MEQGRRQLELAIAAQEGLRGTIGDEIVDAAVAALRQRARAHPGFTNDNEDEIGRILGRIGLEVDDVDLTRDPVDNPTLIAAAEALVAELQAEPASS